MKKIAIGFHTKPDGESVATPQETAVQEAVIPRKSVVQVYFPHRGMSWAYYNDCFDLKVGDLVYVEGKMEGCRGQVTEVNYSFKIKPSDYKKVIAVVDTRVKGDVYLVAYHVVSFDPDVLPFSRILTWFKAPENEDDYISGDDDSSRFSLENLSQMKISHQAVNRGQEHYLENDVSYLELDGTRGRAIVEGKSPYVVEFTFCDGEISNLKCSCFCCDACSHQYAAMLQLKDTLNFITKHYEELYNNYFAIISKEMFMKIVMNQEISGKISLEG